MMGHAVVRLLLLFCGREVKDVMAMLFCTRLILGKLTYDQVPAKLRAQVDELLRENGLEDLIGSQA